MFASDEVVWVSWRYSDEEQVPNLKHTNEVLGAYVTTGERLRLYHFLDKVQEIALYCDTDSIIYVQKKASLH
jgi:ribosome biogenesis protein Nip4